MDNLIDFLQESRPSHSILSSITVIGPYPSKNFIKRILEKFNPNKINLIIDYSAKNAIDDIKSAVDNKILNIKFVRSECVGGLVHSKVYLLKWEIKKTKKYKRVLFVGSANASNNGFLKNAETLQSIPVSSIDENHRKKLRDYFKSLDGGNGSKQLILRLLSGSKLWLPGIIQANDNVADFSGWIRNGIICHKFDPDGTFGKLNIHLKSPLPKTVHEATLSKRGFSRKTKKEILSRRYIEIGNDNAKATWKGKYFTETWLGHWASYECYKDSRNGKLTSKDGEIIRFLSSDSEFREVAINKILNANTQLTNTWENECLLELNNAYQELVKRKKTPSLYFEMKKFNLSLVNAKKAYKLGYPLVGLKKKLSRNGYWK